MSTFRRLLTFSVVVSAALATASAAHAHDDEGIFNVESADTSQPGVVALVVRLIYSVDKEPATMATVTATPVSPARESLTPVPLTLVDRQGRYSGVLTLPSGGDWTIRLAALDPVATLEAPVAVVAPTATTATSTTVMIPAPSAAPGAPRNDTDLRWPLLSAAGFAVVVAVSYVVSRVLKRRAE